MLKRDSYSNLASKYIDRLDRADKLRAIANRTNYPYKLKKLSEKVQSEHDFWMEKNSTERLLDLKKDLTFIQQQQTNLTSKERVDLLMEKYGLN